MTNETDCPICLDPIIFNELEEYIILECCNKQVHLSCLIDWSKSVKNVNKNACVLCRQETMFLQDFHNSLFLKNTIIDIPIEENTSITRNMDISYIHLTYRNSIHDLCWGSCLLSTFFGGILYIIVAS